MMKRIDETKFWTGIADVTSAKGLDRGCPLFKKWSEGEGQRSTRYAEEMVAKSEKLQRLDNSCRDLSPLRPLTPNRKSLSRKGDALSYMYSISGTPETTVTAVTDELLKSGWRLTKKESELWEDQTEFEKDEYWIRTAVGGFGESNLAVNCKDKSIAR